MLYLQDSYFLRCIKPNNNKKIGVFDEEFVLKQLNTSSTVSYARFIRYGYPKRIDFQKITDACSPIENNLKNICSDRYNFYAKVLISIGFKFSDFKLGNDVIFFRAGKFDLIQAFLSDLPYTFEEGSEERSTAKRQPK